MVEGQQQWEARKLKRNSTRGLDNRSLGSAGLLSSHDHNHSRIEIPEMWRINSWLVHEHVEVT